MYYPCFRHASRGGPGGTRLEPRTKCPGLLHPKLATSNFWALGPGFATGKPVRIPDSPIQKAHRMDGLFEWRALRGSVTSGDPETTRLKTSFHRKISLRTATGSSHPLHAARAASQNPDSPLETPTESGCF